MRRSANNKFLLFNLEIFSGNYKEVVEIVDGWIKKSEKHFVCVRDAHGLVLCINDVSLHRIHKRAGLVVPDGMPIAWLGRFKGYKDTTRIYGPDLMLYLCKMAERRGYNVFFYGTNEHTLERLREQILIEYPKIRITGSFAPPYRELTESEKLSVRKKINNSKAQLVFVGLSTPKQEIWMDENIEYLKTNALVGVGAGFDFNAGLKKQAPRWVQYIGLEWFYRLLQEPRRLSGRYFRTIPLFMWFVIIDLSREIKSKYFSSEIK